MNIINCVTRTMLLALAITTVTVGNAGAYVAAGVHNGHVYHRVGHVGGVHRAVHPAVHHRWYNPRDW